MAKTINGVAARLDIRRKSDGTWHLKNATYMSGPKDDVDGEITYANSHTPTNPRALTAGELAGTLQAFLDACDDDYKTANGIA